MRIVKEWEAPVYKSPEEYRRKAEKYFEYQHRWLLKNPNHNVKFSENPEHRHYTGYCTLEKGWNIRQPEVDALKARIKELESK